MVGATGFEPATTCTQATSEAVQPFSSVANPSQSFEDLPVPTVQSSQALPGLTGFCCQFLPTEAHGMTAVPLEPLNPKRLLTVREVPSAWASPGPRSTSYAKRVPSPTSGSPMPFASILPRWRPTWRASSKIEALSPAGAQPASLPAFKTGGGQRGLSWAGFDSHVLPTPFPVGLGICVAGCKCLFVSNPSGQYPAPTAPTSQGSSCSRCVAICRVHRDRHDSGLARPGRFDLDPQQPRRVVPQRGAQ